MDNDQTNSLSPLGRLEQIRSALKELSFAREALPGSGNPEAFEFFLRKLETSKHSTTSLVKACQILHQPNTEFERRKFPLLTDITRIAYDLDQSTALPVDNRRTCVKCNGDKLVVLTPDGRAYTELANVKDVKTAAYPCPMCRNEAAMQFTAVRRWFARGMPTTDPEKSKLYNAAWERIQAARSAENDDDDPRRKPEFFDDPKRFGPRSE